MMCPSEIRVTNALRSAIHEACLGTCSTPHGSYTTSLDVHDLSRRDYTGPPVKGELAMPASAA